jgi:hypothetical protein
VVTCVTFGKETTQMLSFRNSLALVCIVSFSTTTTAGGSTKAAPQDKSRNTVVELDYCANPMWASLERGKPFIAERVVKSSAQPFQHTEIVARDTAGRVRIEQHLRRSRGNVSPQQDADTIMAADDQSELSVEIFDCLIGKSISLHPKTQSAIIMQSCADPPRFQASEHPYSYKLTQLLGKNTDPNVTVEDLGYKQIQNVKSRGIRITWLGSEKDTDLKGKPIRAIEQWMSDDLGVTMLWVHADLARGIENRASVTSIRREEPDSSLFTIPPGYNITYFSDHAQAAAKPLLTYYLSKSSA